MDAYFERFGGVRDYLRRAVDEARATGYTATLFGRRRYLPDLNSDNRQRREAAERMALNAPIQGTAADIVKIAMLNVDRALEKADLKSRMLLQVHDEIVLEIAPGERAKTEELLRHEMADAVHLRAPLDVSVGVRRRTGSRQRTSLRRRAGGAFVATPRRTRPPRPRVGVPGPRLRSGPRPCAPRGAVRRGPAQTPRTPQAAPRPRLPEGPVTRVAPAQAPPGRLARKDAGMGPQYASRARPAARRVRYARTAPSQPSPRCSSPGPRRRGRRGQPQNPGRPRPDASRRRHRLDRPPLDGRTAPPGPVTCQALRAPDLAARCPRTSRRRCRAGTSTISVAVHDDSGLTCARAVERQYDSASIVKVLIMEGYSARRDSAAAPGWETTNVRPMSVSSDTSRPAAVGRPGPPAVSWPGSAPAPPSWARAATGASPAPRPPTRCACWTF